MKAVFSAGIARYVENISSQLINKKRKKHK
jgi:hypothetical protein